MTEQVLSFPYDEDTGPGEWVAQCPECPTTRDELYGCERRQEWVFKVGDLPGAKAFAARHLGLVSHEVQILRRVTFTATYVHPDLRSLLAAAGDPDTKGDEHARNDMGISAREAHREKEIRLHGLR